MKNINVQRLRQKNITNFTKLSLFTVQPYKELKFQRRPKDSPSVSRLKEDPKTQKRPKDSNKTPRPTQGQQAPVDVAALPEPHSTAPRGRPSLRPRQVYHGQLGYRDVVHGTPGPVPDSQDYLKK